MSGGSVVDIDAASPAIAAATSDALPSAAVLDSQVPTLAYWQFSEVTPAQAPLLTQTQIASIPTVGWFETMSAATRAALSMPQVRALNVADVRITLLTPTQVTWLTTAQIQSLKFYDFALLGPSQTAQLTPAQIATIPDTGSFVTWTTAARAALSAGQVQALNTATIRLDLLTAQQIGWLTTAQVQRLDFYQFPLLGASQIPSLTPAQIASIPDGGTLSQWSAAARLAMTVNQVRSLRVATIGLYWLSPEQRDWLTPAQVQSLAYWNFPYLSGLQTPNLTPAQIAAIPDTGSFVTWTTAARAALSAGQVQALNTATIRLDLLTAQQIGWLTTAQVQRLDFYQFPLLGASQVPSLTPAQIASIPDPGTFSQWSTAARAALTTPQLQSLNVAALHLYLLSSQQIAVLTVAQVQSLSADDIYLLPPALIPWLTTAQIASLPSNYGVRTWSDEQMAQLTRPQILAMSRSVYGAFISLQQALQPPTNYTPVDPDHSGHGKDLDAPSAEADQFFRLVPLESATHVTIASGDWTDPRIWRNGVVPGLGARVVISAGTNVRFTDFMNQPIFTLRVDGTLKFATNLNTQLRVDTIVVTTRGVLHIGSAEAPIADNVSARIVIANNGPIDTTWDPYLWSRGLVSRGEVRMMGRVVTPFVNLAVDPRAGDTTLVLAQAPTGWRVGDTLVIGGTSQFAEDFGTERVIIRAINGTFVTVDPLQYTHDAPDGEGLSIQAANMNRNVQFINESILNPAEMPHIAFVHNPNVDVANIGVYGFGRTDKTKPINSPVVVNGVLQPGTGTNPRARYAIHFHHTGVDPAITPAAIRGSVAMGSPGWGYVNHSSNVVMENNVAFGMIGSGFVTEDGNEIGVMRGNLAINMYGSGQEILARQADHDFGHGGHGFWFQGPGVEVVNNISVGSRRGGFVYLTQSSKNLFDAVNLDPEMAGGRAAVPVGTVPLKKFDGNTAIAARNGLEIWHHMTLMTDGTTVINNFTAWNLQYAGIDLEYVGRVSITNSKLLGDRNYYAGVGIATNRLTHDVAIANSTVDGFEVGIDVPVRRTSYITATQITAVQGLFIEKGYDTIRSVTVDPSVAISSPTTAQLRGRRYYAVFATAKFSFEYPMFLDRRVDSLLSQDVIRLAYNGSATGQLYYFEQAPGYIPFPSSTSYEYVPSAFLDKTNTQLQAEFGVSLGGSVLPMGAMFRIALNGLVRF
jgi:DNA polymerase III psi subunit